VKKVHLHVSLGLRLLNGSGDEKLNFGDHFFTGNNISLFEAMSAFWKRLTAEAHHEFIHLMDLFHE
jgi:hypothetical protein